MHKNLLFIAPPAGGKGTICKMLEERDGYVHISTGEMLRSIENADIKKSLSDGNLIDDKIVIDLIVKKLKELNGRPFILDGFPRTLNQGIILDDILKEYNLKIDIVIDLEVSIETLIKRITGRLICPKCNRTYNKFFIPPRVSGICNDCQIPLETRTDDNEETFKVRYKTFVDETYPLVDYYKKQGKVVKIDGEDNIYEHIVSVINDD